MRKILELVEQDNRINASLNELEEQKLIEQISAFLKTLREAGEYVADPEEREWLAASARRWGKFLYDKTGTFYSVGLLPYKDTSPAPRLLRWLRVLGVPARRSRWLLVSIVLAVTTAILILLFYRPIGVFLSLATSTPTPTSSPTSTPTTTPTSTLTPTATPLPTATPTLSLAVCNFRSLYGFESGVMGWKPQTVKGNQAVLQVKQSTERARSGESSLELQVELGGSENNANGEAFVDLLFDPPLGLRAPLDLEGIPLVIWVYVPEEAVGDPEIPNGVQVFVKDESFRSEYGEWQNLHTGNTNRWIAVEFTPTKPPSSLVEMDPGFDPSQIVLIGIKIGVGIGSTVTYTGPIWIDDVCWPFP